MRKLPAKAWYIAAAVLLLALLAVGGWWWHGKLSNDEAVANIYLPTDATEQLLTTVTDFFVQKGYKVELIDNKDQAEFIVDSESQTGIPVRFKRSGKPAELAKPTIVEETSTADLFLSATYETPITQELADILKPALERKTWTLTALGDIIPGRTVCTKMRQLGYTAPFKETAAATKASDLTFANLEATLADGIAYPTTGTTFTCPAEAVDGLVYAGIDGINLANNHAFNGGATAFQNMLGTLQNNGITYFGGGKDLKEARAPQIFEAGAVKIALLGYSSIIGTVPADANSPGQAYFELPPWGKKNETQLQQMAAEITQAHESADMVMVYVQWGEEYQHTASAAVREVAHRLVDAGADLILGTHPHWVQGIEWYKDRLITYSLGNFVFDQEWSLKTKQGVYLAATFEGTDLVGARLVPYQIEDYHQPRPASGALANQILTDVYSHSWWPGITRDD